MKTIGIVALMCVGLMACQTTTGGYKAVSDKLSPLDVKFASAEWQTGRIPAEGICPDFGGKGLSPALMVSNIPAGANAIIVEFSDRNYAPMDNAGHGVVGYRIAPGATTATLPAVPGGTRTLPDGAWVEANNRGTKNPIGYRGACSGGRGNTYEADVKAVYKPQKDGEEGKLLATGRIRLGTY